MSGWAVATAATTDAPPPAPPPPAVAPAPQTAPPPVATPDSKLTYTTREVLKMLSSGVPEDVVKTYIQNTPYRFNLTPDALIQLHEMGISASLTTEMLSHDRTVTAEAPGPVPSMQQNVIVPPVSIVPQQPVATAPSVDQSTVATQPDYSDYYNQLSGYGNWAYMPGYGYGWQPYSGLDYSAYPWWLLGYGSWSFFPSVGWCWFPHWGWGFGRGFAHGFGHGFNHGFNAGFNHGFVHGSGGFHPFPTSHFAAGFHSGFHAGMNFSHGGSWGGGGHMMGGGMHFSGGGHMGGGGGHR